MNETIGTFNFKILGPAIKKAREIRGITREQLSERLDITPHHLQSIENEGQYPSFQLFVQLITLFHISADQYIFSNPQTKKSPHRKQLDTILDTLDEQDLTIIEETATSLYKTKEQTKD